LVSVDKLLPTCLSTLLFNWVLAARDKWQRNGPA
jgi:hypothetical protein